MAKPKESATSPKKEEKQTTESSTSSEEKTVEEEKEEEKKEEEKGYQGRFTQFQSDSQDAYLKQLEQAYAESSKEGQRLSGELSEREKEIEVVTKIVRTDPELKDKFKEKIYDTGYQDRYEGEELTPTLVRQIIREENQVALKENPTLQSIDQEKMAQNKKIVEEFEIEHPELSTNPRLASDLEIAFGALTRMALQKGESFDFKKTLFKAWDIVTGGKSEKSELEGMTKVIKKEEATMTSTSSERESSTSKKELSAAEKEIAAKMGLSEEQYSEGKKIQEESKV